MSSPIRILSWAALAVAIGAGLAYAKNPPAASASSGSTQATVYKDGVALHKAASATSPTLASLGKGSAVDVLKQDGLWFNVNARPSSVGYVKINEIRLSQPPAGKGDGYSMFGGHSKPGETAGVRGLDKSKIQGGPYDERALAAMQALRVDDAGAKAYADRMHLQRSDVAYKDEPGVGKGHRAPSVGSAQQQQANSQASHAAKSGLFSMVGGRLGLGSSADSAADAMPKSEQEKVDEETYMGPQVAGRFLGAVPMLDDPGAQRRVNTIGHWVAMQTPRDDLSWTFAILDSDEINAFAAPGGYVFMTRGLYDILQSDDEVAAVLGHEISHVVARDHYNVIRKQAGTSALTNFAIDRATSHGGIAGSFANYFAKQGASVLLTVFDRDVEYRSDGASLIYAARAGYNPLAMYAVLQKLAAVDPKTNRLSDLYATHPTATARLDKLDEKGLAGVEAYTDRSYVR